MRGLCIDVVNPLGRLSKRQYNSLGIEFVRAEIRGPSATTYRYPTFTKVALLYGPSTEAFFIPLGVKPLCVIIGNEPDGTGESSWQMTPLEYINLWNTIALQVPHNVLLCTAGMINGPSFLQDVWLQLSPTPDLINVHYPQTKEDIQVFTRQFHKPAIVGETCYYTAETIREMDDWLGLLDLNTIHHAWFCKDNMMVPNMGVYDNNRLTHAGRLFRRSNWGK